MRYGRASSYATSIVALSSLLAVGMAWEEPAQGGAIASLGKVDFEISCAPGVEVEFNHAVALLHHMTYAAARAGFETVAMADPDCAMAHWGIAMTLFQPLWPNRPTPGTLRRGWEEVERAGALKATRRERLFLDAAAAFFAAPESTDFWQRIRRWEKAMRVVYDSYPEDSEAAAFYALSVLASAPVDASDTSHSERASELLVKVYRKNPDHPGAMHYLIHADDVAGREHEHLEIVRKYETVAPDNPHALHMPTHIYTRLGDWDGVVRGNLRAADAALATPAGEHGELVWDEFPHALEYLVYAYLQEGADAKAAAQLSRFQHTTGLEPTFKTAFHSASIPARYVLERHAWSEAADCVPRRPAGIDWDRFPWPEAVMWFEQGLGAAHQGDVFKANAALNRMSELERAAGEAGETLFKNNIAILRLELAGWIAHASGDPGTGVALLREATALEASTPKHAVTPAPTLPALELLGDLLMAQGSGSEALDAYRESLELYPRRFNSLLGAARAARAIGQAEVARSFYTQLLEVASRDSGRTELAEARSF